MDEGSRARPVCPPRELLKHQAELGNAIVSALDAANLDALIFPTTLFPAPHNRA
jgi:hypothetical protein